MDDVNHDSWRNLNKNRKRLAFKLTLSGFKKLKKANATNYAVFLPVIA